MNTLEKIVNSSKLPVLFIGSGISKRYLYHYPTWQDLLKISFSKFDSDLYQYHKLIDRYKRDGLSDFQINAKLGTYIEEHFNEAFFDRKIKIGSSKNPSWVSKGISPYKMYLSKLFKKLPLNNSAELQYEINKFRQLKNKISAIITTNYDCLIENEIFSNDYSVFIHQNELFSTESYNIAEIYKIHGCVTDAESIIITEKDYNNFNSSRKLIIAKMLTLFSESPIIFMGYSLTDENIRNIIIDFLGCLTENELNHISDHFVFINYKQNEPDLVEIKNTIITDDGNKIPITEIQTDNYSKVYDILNNIVPGISPIKVRETRRVIKKIVDESMSTSSAESIIVGLDNLQNLDLTSKPLAIAIGYKESILNTYGYGLVNDSYILEDILYDNKHFDADNMCMVRFKSIRSNQLLPVFKYVKKTKHDISANTKLINYISLHNEWNKLVPNNIMRQLNSIPTLTNITQIKEEIEKIDDINKKAGVLLKNIQNISLGDVRNICKELFEEDSESAKVSTHFKRCVMYIDLEENYKKES